MGTLRKVYLIFALGYLGHMVCCSTMPQSYDTIVVGLGAAGTTAASTLAKAGKRVLALEAQDRVGGRVHTVPFGDGVVELGAEWIHGTGGSRVYETAIQNNISLVPQEFEPRIYRSDGTIGDNVLVNDLMNFCLDAAHNAGDKPEPLGRFITKKLMEYITEKYPDMLKDQDFINEFLAMMNLIINNYESSNDWNDVSTLTNYKELDGHQHMSWNRHGYKTFFELLLNTYNNGPGWPTLDIKLNKEVTLIKWPQNTTGSVEVTCKDGDVYTADNVIVTVSIGVLKERYKTLFSPPLPDSQISSIDKIPIGVVGKIIFSFNETWWPTYNNFLYQWLKDKEQYTTKWQTSLIGLSTPKGSDNTLTFWTSGDQAKLIALSIADYYQYKTCRHSSLFVPALPSEKHEAIDNISIGVMDKIIIKFDKPLLTTGIFYGFLWRGEDKEKVNKEDHWTTKIFACSTPMGSDRVITFWTSGEIGKMVETLPEDVVKRKCVELLRKFMGKNITIPDPTGMIRSTWYSNPFTRGSYTFDNLLVADHPGARAALGAPLRDLAGSPRVLFAGEATDITHFSTVHGASDSGYREAMRILPTSKV